MDTPESASYPMSYGTLPGFQRLMLLRCFRVDRIYRAVTEYVTRVMGEKYVMPPVISFESIFEQSTPLCPIVFILSPGADPASDLMKLAERMGFGAGKLKCLSLGQGQEKVDVHSPHLACPRHAERLYDTIRYDTIRYSRFTCAQKLTRWPA